MSSLLGSITTVAVVACATASSALAQWENADVDTLAGTSADEASSRFGLALDADGLPHAIWSSQSLGFYSRADEMGDWAAPIEIGHDDAVYTPHAIAIAPGSTTPVVLYSRRPIGSPSADLHLALWNGSAFDEVPLETGATTTEYSPALAIDGGGRYHVVCVSEVSGVWRLRYLSDVTGAPTDRLVDAGPLGDFGSGASPSIAAEADGRVRIVYRGISGIGYRIHHVANDAPGGTSWTWEALVTPNGEDLSADIELDAADGAHVGVSGNDCFGCSPRTYYLHQPPGETWQPPIFVTLTTGLSSPSVAVDATGRAHLAMAEVSGNIYTGRIYYASAATGFGPTLIIGVDHGAPSLAIDGDGLGHLVCTTGPNSGVEDVLHLRSGNLVVGIGEDAPPATPPGARLLAAPNPFEDTIVFRLAGGGATGSTIRRIGIYDALGRRIREMIVSGRAVGAVTWDGRDTRGTLVPPGVYIARPASPHARPVKVVRHR